MSGYRLTPRARTGLIRMTLHVEGQFGQDVAHRVIDALEQAFERLAEHPGIGHRREDLTADEHVLFWSVGPTLIAYREFVEGVEILFVERGELDWEHMLEEEL